MPRERTILKGQVPLDELDELAQMDEMVARVQKAAKDGRASFVSPHMEIPDAKRFLAAECS
jgi:hypothetical protein